MLLDMNLLSLAIAGVSGLAAGGLVMRTLVLKEARKRREELELLVQQTAQEKVLAEYSEQQTRERLHDIQQQMQMAQEQLQSNQKQLADQAMGLGKLEERDATLKTLREELLSKEQKLDQQVQQVTSLSSELSKLKEAQHKDKEHYQSSLKLLDENKQQLLKDFEHLSNKIYEQKQKDFTQQSRDGMSALLNPFKEQMQGLQKKVEEVYVQESKDRTALATQITDLHKLNVRMSDEANALTRALKGESKTQGNWGELVLETVLEQSGLREGVEYVREAFHKDDEGKSYRPDVIINLPENKHIVVDSKVSLTAYSEYVSTENAQEQAVYLKAHIESIKKHINDLSEKAYQKLKGVNSPDFVFLFMPVEPAFMLAFQHDEKLFNQAFEKRIVVVTPTTLLASLRTVSSLWALEKQNKSTLELAERAAKLHDKFVGFVSFMQKLGNQMQTTQKTYDDAWKNLKEGNGNLIGQVHQLKELGIRTKKDLPKDVVESIGYQADKEV